MPSAFELFESLTGESMEPAAVESVPAHITLDGNRIKIDYDAKSRGGFDWDTVNAMKALPGRKYEGGTVNSVNVDPKVVQFAEQTGLVITDEARQACESADSSRDDGLLAASYAADSELDVPGSMALTPRPYQKAGIRYAIEAGSTWIADEQGLGKTLQAQGVVEVRQTYPALVVCKAKLRGNWAREIGLTLPDRKVQVLTGQTPYAIDPDADFVVISYSILSYWVEAIKGHGFEAMILDESQYVKNHESKTLTRDGQVVRDARGKPVRVYKTQRVRAAKEISDALPKSAPRLLLTGTAMFNRPIELAAQLDVMGRLSEFGGFFQFAKTYAGAFNNGYGWDFSGHSNVDHLRESLRSKCFVRRKKKDVATDIPDKMRVPVWLTLNGELDEYNEVYDEGPADTEAGEMAWMSTLRRLVGEAKVESAVEWAEDFLDADEPQSLLIFAHHRDVQRGIAQGLGENAVLLMDLNDAELEEAKAKFQNGQIPVLVASLEAHSEGHTLTRASNVLMVERAWGPKREEQAEDRVHRIGQDQPVTIHYLMALGTIDESMDELIENKRDVIDRAQDGGTLTAEDQKVLESADIREALLQELTERKVDA